MTTTENTSQPVTPLVRSSVSRRTFLAGLPVAALALAACSSNSPTATATSAGASTVASSSGAVGSSSTATAAAGASGDTSTGGVAPAAGSVAALALAFKATLSSDLQTTLSHDYTLANAELWSNLPQGLLGGSTGGGASGMPSGMSGMPTGGARPTGAAGGGTGGGIGGTGAGAAGPRLGIKYTDLGATQLAAFTTLLKAATGSGSGVGYAEIQQHLDADDYLAANGGGTAYGRANFYIAFLGTPSDTGTWELQFGGHHLAVANTYKDGVLVGATPSFRGIEPNGKFTQAGTTNDPLAVKEAAFKAMLAGIPAAQLAGAELTAVYSDLVLTPGKDWAFPTAHEGLQVSKLAAAQQKLVLTAIASYVNDIADADAKTILAKYESELDSTYVAYSGTTALTEQNDYVRIDGPSVWIEFSMQHGIVLSGNHPHSVWRDRNTDYGGTKS